MSRPGFLGGTKVQMNHLNYANDFSVEGSRLRCKSNVDGAINVLG